MSAELTDMELEEFTEAKNPYVVPAWVRGKTKGIQNAHMVAWTLDKRFDAQELLFHFEFYARFQIGDF